MERFSSWTLAIGLGIYILGVAVSQSLMSLGGTLLCVQALLCLGRLRLLGDRERRLGSVVLSLVLWNLATLVFRAVRREDVAWGALELLPLILIPLLAVLASPKELDWLRSRRVSRTLLFLAIFGFAASTLNAIYQGFIEGRMATAFLRNPIFLAYNLLFPFVLLLSLIPKMRERRAQALGFAFVVLTIAAMLATNSRMVLALALGMTALLLGRWILRRVPGLVIIAVLGALGGLAVHEYQTKWYVRERIAALGTISHPSTQGRLKVWSHNLELVRKHPITGTGYKQNALQTRSLEPFWQNLWGENVSIYAHNIYLQAAAESGLIGLALLLIFFASWLSVFPSTWPIILALCLGGLTENILTNSKQIHSLLCVLLVAGLLARLRRDPLEENTDC